MEFLIAIGFFGLVSALVYMVVGGRGPVTEDAIQRRLESIGIQSEARSQIRLHEDEEITLWERAANFSLADRVLPDRFHEIGRRLHEAGYRGNRAVRVC